MELTMLTDAHVNDCDRC